MLLLHGLVRRGTSVITLYQFLTGAISRQANIASCLSRYPDQVQLPAGKRVFTRTSSLVVYKQPVFASLKLVIGVQFFIEGNAFLVGFTFNTTGL